MKCLICKTGETNTGQVVVTLNRQDTVVVIKNVPAEICENCGEYYLSDSVTEEVLNKAEEAVKKALK